MLTNKSRWLSFRSTNGQKASKEMLQSIYKNMVLEDFINFGTDMSKGFPKQIASLLAAKVDVKDATKVAVLNDLSFELYDELTDMGVKPENIYMVFGTWEKGGKPSMRRPVYEIMVDSAKANFEEFANDCTNFITTEELFNLNIKFDYIIANPPYAIGNEITRAVIDNVDFDKYINLMPASKYKKGELFKQVSCVESAPDEFEDAAVGDSLTVAVLENNANVYPSYEEFSNNFRDERFVEFYRLNSACKKLYRYVGCTTESSFGIISIDTTFVDTARAANGVSKSKDSLVYKYNILRDYKEPFTKQNKNGGYAICAYYLNSITEKDNFSKFYYYNSLMNDLLKGLKQSSGSIELAIPRIDYSKDRDYEHLTLEDIMQILREENPDVAE